MQANYNIIQAVKTFSKTKKKKLVLKRGIKSNKMLEYDYYGIIKVMVTRIKESFKKIVLPNFKLAEDIITDAELPKLENVVIEWKRDIETKFDDETLKSVSKKYVDKVDRWQKLKFRTAVNYGFGIDISTIPEFIEYKEFINNEIKKNLELLKDLRDETIHKLEIMLRTAIERGTSSKQIVQELNKISDVSENRAKFIARNEVKNITTMLTKKRMLNVGFEEAEWSSSQDERVRTEHKEFNKHIYKIGVGLKNKKGEYEEAGEAYNCRCVALPIINLEE